MGAVREKSCPVRSPIGGDNCFRRKPESSVTSTKRLVLAAAALAALAAVSAARANDFDVNQSSATVSNAPSPEPEAPLHRPTAVLAVRG